MNNSLEGTKNVIVYYYCVVLFYSWVLALSGAENTLSVNFSQVIVVLSVHFHQVSVVDVIKHVCSFSRHFF